MSSVGRATVSSVSSDPDSKSWSQGQGPGLSPELPPQRLRLPTSNQCYRGLCLERPSFVFSKDPKGWYPVVRNPAVYRSDRSCLTCGTESLLVGEPFPKVSRRLSEPVLPMDTLSSSVRDRDSETVTLRRPRPREPNRQ